jgi:transcriptional regulator with XRE-family HTH domain
MSDRTYAIALGTQLRDRRKLLRLNQTEVAELAGTTQRTVSLVESGKAAGIELYLAVADVLGLEVTLQPHDEQAMRRDSAGESPR